MLDHLEGLSIFCDLNNDELDAIALFCEDLEFDEGEVIISERSKDAFDLYVLVHGSVEIVGNAQGSHNLSEEVVISKKEKDVFGEIGWLCHQQRTATVRSYSKTRIIRVNGDALNRFLAEHPEAGYKVMRRMACVLAESLAETSSLLKQLLWANGI